MKSYLSLIPISARVHRRQNRMTILCIVIAVFLVTGVFSMAEMGVRMEWNRLNSKHGSVSLGDLLSGSWGQTLFLIAGVLFLLILLAGVLMISGSINSSVAQRTKFFGMMRCLGMTGQQTIRFVKLEALNWCKTAIPIGLVLGTIATWGLCVVLRYRVGGEFAEMPVFGISAVGLVSGVVVGVVTVLLAARAPAKRASRVSPITAVSGNADGTNNLTHAANTRLARIETALGIHHAVESKKNLLLMTGSFALSIILFLSFSTLIEFVGFLVPQSHSDPDITILSDTRENDLPDTMLLELSELHGINHVYGRRSLVDVSAEVYLRDFSTDMIDIISFDDYELECLKTDHMLQKGSHEEKVFGNSDSVLATWDPNSPLHIGDTIQVGSETLVIAGLLKHDPFYSDGMTQGKITIISSTETFIRLTGITDYRTIMLQLTSDATEEDVRKIYEIAGDAVHIVDGRDTSTKSTYFAFVACVYAFLAIIALITVLNIVNSISMSVTARMKQYGAMRAVGMDGRQVTKMIAAEAFTYSLSGCVVGCVLGLLISREIFAFLIEEHFSYASWRVPVGALALIVAFVLGATALSFYAPSKRIGRMAVTETLGEL